MVLPLAVPLIVGGAMAAGGGGAMFGASRIGGTAPRQQYYGGSFDQNQDIKRQYKYGQEVAQEQTQAGLDAYTSGVGQAQALGANQGADLYGTGRTMIGGGLAAADRGMAEQQDAMAMLRGAATGAAPSQAELMLRADAERAGRQAMSQASQARGGNQAAAMRAALDARTTMALQAQEQAGQLRAAEMAQARSQYAGAAGDYAQSNLARGQLQAGLGMQQTGMGLGLQTNAANAQMGLGQAQMAQGLGREEMFFGAEQNMRDQQLAADTGYDESRAKNNRQRRDNLYQFGSSMIGGGGKLAATGGAAG